MSSHHQQQHYAGDELQGSTLTLSLQSTWPYGTTASAHGVCGGRWCCGTVVAQAIACSVQQVVSKDVDVGVLRRHPSGHGKEVPDVVVRRDVPGIDCGVVGGPSPVLPTAYFEPAVLVLLQNREGRGCEDVPRRSFKGPMTLASAMSSSSMTSECATGLPITLAPASHVEDLSHVGSGHSACYDAAASCTAQCTDVTTSGVHRQGSGPINSGSSFSPPPQRSHIAEVDQSFHRVARRPLRSCLKRQTFAAPSPVEVEPHLPSTPPVVHSLKQVRFSFEVGFWFPADDQLNLSLPFKARSAARSLHSSEVCLFKGGSCRTLAGTLPHGQDPSCHFAADFARAHVL